MLEQGIEWLQQLDPAWIYAAIFFIAWVENVFPPSPSDMMVVFGGYLCWGGRAHISLTLDAAVIGSTLGFVTMYGIGYWFGEGILESGKLKFIPRPALHKVQAWVRKWGYWVIAANRFLAGTRAVVSFFAGMSEINLLRTTVLSFFSSLAWNAVLVFAGYTLGKNWRSIEFYLVTYSTAVTVATALVLLFLIVRALCRRRKARKEGSVG